MIVNQNRQNNQLLIARAAPSLYQAKVATDFKPEERPSEDCLDEALAGQPEELPADFCDRVLAVVLRENVEIDLNHSASDTWYTFYVANDLGWNLAQLCR